ncbi:MAG: M28 family peptidase [Promethearchaeota archaeon]|nr:MAG: M28 family peptidase [Candidatus Lokiarchaeota archaeon]
MIDINDIRENLETFSFPRLSGTEHEVKAFKILKNRLDALKLKSVVQNFSFSTFYSRIYPKIASILMFWILLVLYLSFNEYFVLINILIIIILYLPLFIITRKPEKIRIGKVLNSQNLYLKIPTNSKENFAKKGNILIMSHIDSKGQRFTTIFRGKIFRFWIYSFILSFVFFILRGLFFPELILLFYIIGAILLIINLISTIFVLLNTTNNKSQGALDDASGISCVLELLKYYQNPQSRLTNYTMWFIFTGAEESGTMGIRHLYNEILKDFDRFNTIALNFDSIGKDPIIFSSAREDHPHYHLYKKFFENSQNFNAKLNAKRPLISIARSDGSFLYHQGFRGMGFGDINVYKYLHSINDTLDKVDPLILKKLCLLIINFLEEIDKQS